MKIRVDEIKDKARELCFDEPVEAFPSLVDMARDGAVEFLGPIGVQLSVGREFDHIRVKGTVAVKVRQGCSRCLVTVETDVCSSFTMFYTAGDHLQQDEEEVELAEEDLVSVTYSGDEIDFSPEIAEQVVMEIPFKPLCREGCAGLCATCGIDLNQSECDCERGTFNVKFGALKNFKVEK